MSGKVLYSLSLWICGCCGLKAIVRSSSDSGTIWCGQDSEARAHEEYRCYTYEPPCEMVLSCRVRPGSLWRLSGWNTPLWHTCGTRYTLIVPTIVLGSAQSLKIHMLGCRQKRPSIADARSTPRVCQTSSYFSQAQAPALASPTVRR